MAHSKKMLFTRDYTEIDFDKAHEDTVEEDLKNTDVGAWHNTVIQEPPVHQTLLVWDDVYCKYRLCEVNDFVSYWIENDTQEQFPFRHTYWLKLTKPDGLEY